MNAITYLVVIVESGHNIAELEQLEDTGGTNNSGMGKGGFIGFAKEPSPTASATDRVEVSTFIRL